MKSKICTSQASTKYCLLAQSDSIKRRTLYFEVISTFPWPSLFSVCSTTFDTFLYFPQKEENLTKRFLWNLLMRLLVDTKLIFLFLLVFDDHPWLWKDKVQCCCCCTCCSCLCCCCFDNDINLRQEKVMFFVVVVNAVVVVALIMTFNCCW